MYTKECRTKSEKVNVNTGAIMKKYLLVILFLCFMVSEVFSQFAVKVRTDKTEYQYGEPITIMVDVINKGDSNKIIHAGCFSTWQAGFIFNELDNQKFEWCLTLTEDIFFPPQSTRTYSWKINPGEHGLPQKNGEQIIIAYMRQLPGLFDTAKIKAPKYLGGLLSVSYNIDLESQIKPIYDSLKAISKNYFLFNGKVSVDWAIRDYALDSAVNRYGKDKRFNWFEALYLKSLRPSISVTDIKNSLEIPAAFELYDAYPNPFNPLTNIKYEISKSSFVSLKVYDMLGREIATLVDEIKQPGSYNSQFSLNNLQLSSGIYFYQLKAGNFIQTKKMLLLK